MFCVIQWLWGEPLGKLVAWRSWRFHWDASCGDWRQWGPCGPYMLLTRGGIHGTTAPVWNFVWLRNRLRRGMIVRLVLLALAVLLLSWRGAEAQSFPRQYLSAASTNSNLVNAGPTYLRALVVGNSTATTYFLKLYNKATAPTCGTDTPLWTVPVPAASTPSVTLSDGLQFPLGLGLCLTGAIAANDTTSAAAGVAINLGITSYP